MSESERSNVDYTLRDRKLDQGIQERKLAHGGRGSSGGGMDAWQQSVESRLATIDAQIRDMRKEASTQFLWLVGLLITVMVLFFGGFGSLLAVMARGFGWL
ncbi:MAG: hypothetical protein ACREJ5_16430 [Geminicoccaceae bacterium]